MTPGGARVAVIGAGWSGLAAAIEAVRRGAHVTLFEMAAQAGGRARDVVSRGTVLDNGQHICIGAYVETLRLLRDVGVAEGDAFLRRPLTLVDADGRGLRLGRGPIVAAFAVATLRRTGWRWRERFALLATAARWRRMGFRCQPHCTVADLCAGLPLAIRTDFIDPLCVAALNTPAGQASGIVFLRVLRDALTAGPGSADLLLPRRSLTELLPAPALAWLGEAGATVRLGDRVEVIERVDDFDDLGGAADGDGVARPHDVERPDRLRRVGRGGGGRAGWRVGDSVVDAVVLAASANESARLAAPHAPEWARRAAAFDYQPIITVYAQSDGCRLPEPMLALRSDDERPAQFVFDRGQLGGPPGLLAFVVSGAREWLERGARASEEAVLAQATTELHGHLRAPLAVVRTLIEKRATFACTPALGRPAMAVASGLFACGDYVDGPYPATLEGAIRSGLIAARAATG